MCGQTRSQCMGNSQYRKQHYITYHGYKYSLPSVTGFIRQSADYNLFPPPEISGMQGSERVKIGRTNGKQGSSATTMQQVCYKIKVNVHATVKHLRPHEARDLSVPGLVSVPGLELVLELESVLELE